MGLIRKISNKLQNVKDSMKGSIKTGMKDKKERKEQEKREKVAILHAASSGSFSIYCDDSDGDLKDEACVRCAAEVVEEWCLVCLVCSKCCDNETHRKPTWSKKQGEEGGSESDGKGKPGPIIRSTSLPANLPSSLPTM
jgi:hypothetical protein